MNSVIILAVIFILASVFVFGKNTPMKKMFSTQVETEIGKSKVGNEVFIEDDISNLPDPVQKYFRYCGYIGKKKMSYAELIWDDVNFKLGVDKPWLKIKYQQYNFVSEPMRIAYIYSKMYNVMPFEGIDKYSNGQGNMIGKLLKRLTIFDVVGDEINVSAAVTYLSESLVIPASALQPYIKWESIDQSHAKAMIDYKGIQAEGIFTFNEKGEFIKFETDTRYMDTGNGTSEKHKWTAEAGNYVEKNGLKIPTKMKGIWNLPEGDYMYFDGNLTDIKYSK